MTLADLAEASRLPARTIRFYIARGLLKGPEKGGRAAAYNEDHVAELGRIMRLQAEGRTLSEIARMLGTAAADEAAVAPPVAWWQHAIADDVTVWVKAGVSPWRAKQLRRAVEEFALRVGPALNREEEEEDGRNP